MKCMNHKKRNSIGTCTGCGEPYCAECMIKVGRKNLCKKCAAEQLEERNSEPKKVVIDKPRGSGGWLCFWIIMLWPMAIVYYLIRRWD